MKRAQEKKEIRKTAPKRRVSRAKQAAPACAKLSQEELACTEFWKEEVQALEQTVFADMNQAVEALVERVLERLQLPPPARAETREFLLLLLDTDEEIKEELSGMLKIKG
jgi:hypothetical protein